MTDLEKVRLCAEAMGYMEVAWNIGPVKFDVALPDSAIHVEYHIGNAHVMPHMYDPLTDDEQAMALVKKMEIRINRRKWYWTCRDSAQKTAKHKSVDADLNRAIVDCVAALQAANRGKE